ncbi:MAG: aldo/keto reductase [Xanthomonadaceae bacterium]|nr:aldo/keto reductase [Xanthomonadaceae bacterium]
MNSSIDRMTRRELLKAAAFAGASSCLGISAHAATTPTSDLITRAIPSTGERIGVVGLGTNNYSVTAPEELAARKEVLAHMWKLGGTLIDTAPAYGRSEEVIGELLAQLGNRDRYFIATKATAPNDDAAAGRAMIEESFRRLRTDHIELIQVHSLMGLDTLMPILQELKAARRIKYLGATTSSGRQHAAMADALRKYKMDFMQINYSIDDRDAASTLLPLAQERGTAVLVNVPFGGRRGSNVFARVRGQAVPTWASEFATSWAQFFLKYVVSHPAVTCAIPGTTKLAHLEDNQAAARGALPDASMRKRMEAFWDGLS